MDKVLQGNIPVIPGEVEGSRDRGDPGCEIPRHASTPAGVSPARDDGRVLRCYATSWAGDDGEVVWRSGIPAPMRRISTPAAPIGSTQSRLLPDDPQEGVSAAVLIGGRSRRMGQPKAILRLEPDGPTLIEMVVTALRKVATGVFLVGEPDWPLPASLRDMCIVEDARQGAADGVIAALTAIEHDFCLMVGCDMPFLDSSLLADMVTTARQHNRSVIARDSIGVHPLHAVYRRDDLGRIETMVAAGERSLTRVCAAIGAIEVEAGSDDTRIWSIFNVNTPADLAAAREHAAQQRSSEGETHS